MSAGAIAASPITKRVSGPLWRLAEHGRRQGSHRHRHRWFYQRLTGLALWGMFLVAPVPGGAWAQEKRPDGELGFDVDAVARLLNKSDSAGGSAPRPGDDMGGHWQCGDTADLAVLSVLNPRYVLNNFRLREDTGMLSNRPFAEFSFSAVNRTSDPLFLTVQILGRTSSGTDPVIAISAEPTFGMIASDTTEQMSASVNSRPGEVAEIKHICLRVDG